MVKKQRKIKYSWGIIAAIDVVGGKWKPLILYELKDETLREFCDKMQELREEIDQIDKDIENVKEDYAEKASNRGEHRL